MKEVILCYRQSRLSMRKSVACFVCLDTYNFISGNHASLGCLLKIIVSIVHLCAYLARREVAYPGVGAVDGSLLHDAVAC